MQTKKTRQGEQRHAQCVGEVHEFRGVKDREEREGT